MEDIIAETDTMDNETVQTFIGKLDMACIALNDQGRHIDGYGSGAEAAYKLLSEAQVIVPDNQAVAAELASLRRIMDTDTDNIANSGNNHPPLPQTGNTTAKETDSGSGSPSAAEQIMQHWKTKPVIEVLVCVTQDNLKGLADTIDSIAAQVYSNWKLTVVSNIPSPDPIFSQHEILQWVQTNDLQNGLDNAISTSSSDWLGLIEPGSQLDSEALFSIANQDNLKGNNWQIIYSDEDHIDENKSYCQPLRKPDFDIKRFKDNKLIGGFCFIRKALIQKIGGIHLSVKHSNNDMVLRATDLIEASMVGHMPRILFHRPLVITENKETSSLHVNVA